MKPRNVIHLLSGGLDSVTMLYDLVARGDTVHSLLINYGQRHVQELECGRLACRRLGARWSQMNIPELCGLDAKDGWVVPNRNSILIGLAVNLAIRSAAEAVSIGCNSDDARSFPDCREAFIDQMRHTIRSAGYEVDIIAPYLGMTKRQVVALAFKIHVPISETWSCYLGGSSPCGRCLACTERSRAIAV
jgi:7-cyano-7-deazaguanine synthase